MRFQISTIAKRTLTGLLRPSAFAQDVGKLVRGTLLGQLITIAATPILSRLYTPDELGVLAIYAATLGSVGALVTLRYAMAIPIAQSDHEAMSVAAWCCCIVATVFLLSVVAFPLLGNAILPSNLMVGSGIETWLLPAGLLLMGIYEVSRYWAVRTRKYSNLSRTKVTQSALMATVQIAGFHFGTLALIIGHAVGQSAGAWRLGRSLFSHSSFKAVKLSNLYAVAVKFKGFALYNAPAGLVFALSTHIPSIFLAGFFGVATAAFYTIAFRLLHLPTTMIGQAITQVFLGNARAVMENGALPATVRTIHVRLILLGLPVMIAAVLLAPPIFQLILGDEWLVAGHFAQWMAIGIYVQFTVSPVTQVLAVVGKQHFSLIMHIVILTLRLLAIWFGINSGDVIEVIAYLSLANAAAYGAFLILLSQLGTMTYTKWSLVPLGAVILGGAYLWIQ